MGWAPFFRDADLRVFLTLVEAEMQRVGFAYTLGEGVVEVRVNGVPQTLGLGNLAQICATLPAAEWPDAVARHFDIVAHTCNEEARLKSILFDYERVRPLLRIRLGTREAASDEAVDASLPNGAADDPELVRALGAGLEASLVIDMQDAMRSVTREETRPWALSDERLFGDALENLEREPPTTRQTIRGPDDVPITVVEGSSHYTSSRVMSLERDEIPEHHPYGALLVVPARHVYFFHLIEDDRVLYAVNALVSLGADVFDRAPFAISSSVYWLRPPPAGAKDKAPLGGSQPLIAVPTEVRDGALIVSPPLTFVKQVLEKVAQRPS